MAELAVWLHGRLAGLLRRKENGNLQFRYAPDYLAAGHPAIGVAMPLQREAYPHRTCLAVFGGVLPEQDVRRAVAHLLGISEGNDFRLLEELGGDCAGAIEFHLPGIEPSAIGERRVLSPKELDRVLRDLPRRPLAFDGDDAPRMSLAGAQGKLPVTVDATTVSVPESGGAPTTHILKPEPDRFPGLVDNEHFCMSLAREVGMRVAPTSTATTLSGLRYLVVERFDRDPSMDPVRRLHQEDVCQALARLPSEKYQADGGPTVVETVRLLRDVSAAPAQDVPRFWSALVLNVLVGNCDAHGKNYSLLHDTARPTLAPLYDLVSTTAYEELTRRLSMSIDGATSIGEVDIEAWHECARAAGLNATYAIAEVRRVARRAAAAAEALAASAEHANEQAASIAARVREVSAAWAG